MGQRNYHRVAVAAVAVRVQDCHHCSHWQWWQPAAGACIGLKLLGTGYTGSVGGVGDDYNSKKILG